ncbi:hypothetical protein GC163_13670 [bacterium]|nr:hypothetical protein [bacterium]
MPRLLSLLWLITFAVPVLGAEKYTLEEPVDDTRAYGIGMRVDVNGSVQTRGGDNKPTDLSLNVVAAISYRERRMLGPGAAVETFRAVRDYETAQVDIDIADEKSTTKLPEPLKLIVAQGRANGLELYSLGGLLSAQELELVTPPCDSLGFIALLPLAPVEIGEEWTPAPWVAQFLARLEASTKSELKCRLVKVKDDIAAVSFQGSVKGAVQGTPSEVTFSGAFDYDLKAKCIVDASLQQTEKREIGAVSPGLDVKAVLRVLRKPAQVPGRVADPKVLDVALLPGPPSVQNLRFESPWNLSLLHHRDWHLFQQTEQVAIFRLLDQGLFVTQANLSPIPSAKPGEHTSEATFQNDIQRSLGDKLKVLGAGETLPTTDGRYIYRITAEGAINDRAVTWIYYLCADAAGRQASIMFAIDTPLMEKLAERDREFVQTLRFGAPQVTKLLETGPAR